MHLLIMGAPGSGKGTCAVELKDFYSIPHISTGDIFRKAISEKTELGKIAEKLINDGQFVPDDVTNAIVKERLAKDDCQKGFILDGYPRTLEQAKVLTEILTELNITLDAVIDLEVKDEAIEARIVNRRLCKNCGKGYNLISMPPKKEGICDDCGGALYQRDDDTSETILKRLDVYHKKTEPIISYYKELGLLISIDGNKLPKEVVNDIVKKVNN